MNKSDFISSNVLLFNSHTENIIGKTNFTLPLNFNAFLKLNHVNTSTVIAKKTILLNFDESKDLVTIEDYYLWLKLYNNSYKFDFINEPLVYYRLSDKNASLNYYSKKNIRLIILLSKVFISTNKISTRFILIKMIIINFFKYIIKKYFVFQKNIK